MSDTSKPNCPKCHGTGKVNTTSSEPDVGMSLLMGAATHTGYLPMSRSVTRKKTCPRCGGSGKQR